MSPISDSSDVLQVDVSGSNDPNGVSDVEPNSGALTLNAFSLTGVGNVLARETRSDRVDVALKFFPSGVPHVTDVRRVREPVRHDFTRCLVDLSDDRDLVTCQRLNGHAQPAITGAQF